MYVVRPSLVRLRLDARRRSRRRTRKVPARGGPRGAIYMMRALFAWDGTRVRRYGVRKYESTKVREYESTRVREYVAGRGSPGCGRAGAGDAARTRAAESAQADFVKL